MEVIRCPNPKCRRRILDGEGTETEWIWSNVPLAKDGSAI